MSIEHSIERMVSDARDRRARDAERFAALDMDECQLCGCKGPDKRTLAIRCFYAVHEMVPEAIDLHDVPEEQRICNDGYMLRICKACRADFLGRLMDWRNARVARRGRPMDDDGHDADLSHGDSERNIPVRENGSIVYLTEAEYAEWRQRRAKQ